MNRRDSLLALAALGATPLTRAQTTRRLPRIGMATIVPLPALKPLTDAFEKGLREKGLIPGRDVVLDFRSSNQDVARFPELVRELVASKPDVIVTGINANTLAVSAATRSIPIVMTLGADVITERVVTSLARPSGNITGLTFDAGAGSWLKRWEFFKNAVPSLRRVAVLYDINMGASYGKLDTEAANSVGIEIMRRDIGDDFEEAFSVAKQWRADGVYFHPGVRQSSRRDELVAATNRHRLPSNFPAAWFVEAGGLMSYAPDLPDLYRRGADYVSRILKGAKPAELPIEQPTRFELVINLKTAKTLGLTIPQSLLIRADRVIE